MNILEIRIHQDVSLLNGHCHFYKRTVILVVTMLGPICEKWALLCLRTNSEFSLAAARGEHAPAPRQNTSVISHWPSAQLSSAVTAYARDQANTSPNVNSVLPDGFHPKEANSNAQYSLAVRKKARRSQKDEQTVKWRHPKTPVPEFLAHSSLFLI